MNRPNKIATGLNAWLTFEQMCKRKPLFSEAYLSFPIGQLLAARYGGRLRAEVPHPVLGPLKKGRGDKPRIDFAVLAFDKSVELVIETKWLSSSKTLHRDILRDLVRLELARDKFGCDAWLILAGNAACFDTLIADPKFKGHPENLNSHSLLPHGSTREGVVRLNPRPKFREEFLSDVLIPFGGLEMRNIVHLTRFGPYPEAPASGSASVVYLWRLNGRGSPGRFTPPVVKTTQTVDESET